MGLVGVVPVFLNSNATATSYALASLDQQRADLEAQIHQLEADVASQASLNRIETEARERLGMEKPQKVTYVQVNVPSQRGLHIPERFAPGEPPPPRAKAPWWKAILELLPIP